MDVCPIPTSNGWTLRRPSWIANCDFTALSPGSTSSESLVRLATFSSGGKSCSRRIEVWTPPWPLSEGNSGIMSFPSTPLSLRSVEKVPFAYFATGASIFTVVNASNACGMSSFWILMPTSNVGMAMFLVS